MKRNSLFLALAQAAAFSSYAATISVTTTDESNAVQCTLRDAVFSANQDTATGGCVAGNGADIIQFAVPTPATISFSQTGIPSIYAPLDVQGPGSDLLTIQGSGFGIFGTAGNTYSISGISVGGSGFVALRVEDTTVSVDDVVVSGVTTTSSVSAIHAENATVTISNSTISDNSTGGQASGI